MPAALQYAEDRDNDIVVVASDTDILVLLVSLEGRNEYLHARPDSKEKRCGWRVLADIKLGQRSRKGCHELHFVHSCLVRL